MLCQQNLTVLMNETLIKKIKVRKPTKSSRIYSSKVIVLNYYDSSVEFEKDRTIGTLFSYIQKQPREMFYKTRFLKFWEIPGKHLCHSLFLNTVTELRPATLFKKRLW